MEGDWKRFPHEWLLEKCPGYYKQPFDLNKNLLDKLCQLEQINKQCDRDADKVINILKQINEEYTALALRSQKTVDKLKGPSAELKLASQCATGPSSVHKVLEAKKAMLSEIDRKMESMELTTKKFQLRKEIKLYKRKTEDIQNKTSKLEKEMELATKEMEEKKNELLLDEEQVDAELENSVQTLLQLQEELNKVGRKDLFPQSLISEMNELDSLKQRAADLKKNLEKYKGLPPNVLEARKTLRAAQLEEAKLNKRIQELSKF